MTLIYCLHDTAPRDTLTWNDKWRNDDQGLIQCWETGKRLAATRPELAAAARRGELPPLAWKGGLSGDLKMKKKFGSLFYLATIQGLRGEDLQIDTKAEPTLKCSRTGILVTFTADLSKLNADIAPQDGNAPTT